MLHPLAQASPSNPPPSPQSPPADDWASRWEQIIHFLRSAWDYPLFNSGGTEVRLNQLIIALLIVLVGLWVAGRIARLVRRRVTRFKRLDVNAAALIGKGVFYLLAILVTLIALPIAGIPITIFTVLGGAAAIGIGFGAQNLINNFISGLIIMVERPIRLGDIVVVDGEAGRVEEIAARFTRVRRFDGVDMLVPNSKFLESNVLNWTLFDDMVRAHVRVGIAYGSPTEQFRDLLLQVVKDDERALPDPPPVVVFEDFGDNALIFDVYFWARVKRPMDLKLIQSALRFRIDAACREQNITIAFPQRDVHLDGLGPIEVRVKDAAENGGPS